MPSRQSVSVISLRRLNSGQLDCCCTDVSSGFVSRMCSCPSKSCWKPAIRSRVCSLNSSLLRCAMAASNQSHVSQFLLETSGSMILPLESVMAYAPSGISTEHASPYSIHNAAAAKSAAMTNNAFAWRIARTCSACCRKVLQACTCK